MSNRLHNVLFHTHTVSGISICVALYVIFFAGSLSFFRDDIISWERNESLVYGTQMDVDLDVLVDTLVVRHDLEGRTVTLSQGHQEKMIMVSLSPSQDSLASESSKSGAFFYVDPETYQSYTYFTSFTLGEFLYRLHFFAQISYPYGYLLAGLVAFFFLFAIVTGTIVHWNKIRSNFYLFRPGAKLKTVWTDAHTALGVIGLPFQFVYAVTGVVLIVGTTVMLPLVSSVLYNGNEAKMHDDLSTDLVVFPFKNQPATYTLDLNEFAEVARTRWEGLMITKVELQNYGDANMHVIIEGAPAHQDGFTGLGQLAFNAATGEVVKSTDPFAGISYLAGAQQVIGKLHFGNYGGYGLKVVYFLLGIISCFVIVSGVLIWVVARDKKHVAPWKRKSNVWVASVFISICLTMYPVTAFTFSAVKLFLQESDTERPEFLYQVFFGSWLILSVLFSLRKDHYFTTRYCLLLGSFLGLLVPVANGLVTGNWIWKTFNDQHFQLFIVDVFWLITSLVVLFAVSRMRRPG